MPVAVCSRETMVQMSAFKSLIAVGLLGASLLLGEAAADDSAENDAAQKREAAPQAQPASTPPTAVGFDVSFLDKTADPCADFYKFACGGWVARNPVPSDQSRWRRFNELGDRNRATLRAILEKAAAGGAGRAAIDQKIGDAYASCMDEAGIEAKGLGALQPELDRIAALKHTDEPPAAIARLHTIGVSTLFGFGSAQDFKDATQVIAAADQGGLGLPDRDQYLKDDAKSVDLRAKYTAHV